MIPANRYSSRQAAILLDYCIEELRRTQGERAPMEEHWIELQQAYRAKPRTKEKRFPWPGASNIVVPVVATDADTLIARIMGLLFAPEGLWSCAALRPELMDFAPRLQEYLKWAQDAEFGAYEAVLPWITEICILGTGVLKQRYVRESRKIYQFQETPMGTMEQQLMSMLQNHAELRHVPLANFYVPSYANDIASAPWVAERLSLTWSQLVNRVNAGIYTNLERMGWYWNQQRTPTTGARYERRLQELDEFVPGFNSNFDLYEFNVPTFDIDGDGEPESLICTIHEPTGTYARIDFNPFVDQQAPYSVARFLRQANRFYGLGLGDMLEPIQESVTTMTNQRIDNGTIMNVPVFVAVSGSGIKQDEPIWPGAVKVVKSQGDLAPINMGQKADTTMQAELALVNYGQRRTGVNDYIQGGAGEPSVGYSTATTVVNMLREGNKRFDQTMREVRRALAESGLRLVEMTQQFDRGGKPYLVMGEKDGAMVEEVLSFPPTTLRHGLMIDVTATNAAMNKETEIRTNQIIYGLVTQHYQGLLQALGIALNPQVPPPMQHIALQMIQGGNVLARRILDAYGIQDVDRIIPDLQEALNATINSQQFVGAGGAGMGPGLGGPPGLPALPPGSPGAAGPPVGQAGFGGFAGALPSAGGVQ